VPEISTSRSAYLSQKLTLSSYYSPWCLRCVYRLRCSFLRYNSGLLALCLCAGLAGGAVYVHGFKLLSARQKPQTRELAMSAASVASDLGILLGSAVGLFIQACIYEEQGIGGAEVSGSYCES